jgi:hypothetical protein
MNYGIKYGWLLIFSWVKLPAHICGVYTYANIVIRLITFYLMYSVIFFLAWCSNDLNGDCLWTNGWIKKIMVLVMFFLLFFSSHKSF